MAGFSGSSEAAQGWQRSLQAAQNHRAIVLSALGCGEFDFQ